jgi:hypothetical protein
MSKEAYYFSHDTNARRDPKILAMRNEYGNEGYGWYWIIVEMLAEQDGYKLKHAKWVTNAIAMELLCEPNSSEKFVNSLINDYELLSSDGEFFWSESLMRRMNLKEEKRQKRVEAGKKGAQKRWNGNDSEQQDGNAIDMLKQSHNNAIAKDGKGKESKGKESKVKHIKDIKKKYADYVTLTTEEYQKLIEQFGENGTKDRIQNLNLYKGSTGKPYKSDYLTILSWERKNTKKVSNQQIDWEGL